MQHNEIFSNWLIYCQAHLVLQSVKIIFPQHSMYLQSLYLILLYKGRQVLRYLPKTVGGVECGWPMPQSSERVCTVMCSLYQGELHSLSDYSPSISIVDSGQMCIKLRLALTAHRSYEGSNSNRLSNCNNNTHKP